MEETFKPENKTTLVKRKKNAAPETETTADVVEKLRKIVAGRVEDVVEKGAD